MLDETHDPELRSWVESANIPGCDFPIQNLPLGVFRTARDSQPRLGVAIGDSVLDLRPWLDGQNLNCFMALSAVQRRNLRREVSKALRTGSRKRDVLPQTQCEMLLPAGIGDYTDFYASLDHATNVGRMFRPDNPLMPNYKQMPVAYHGRCSSIVASGTPVKRPCGQLAEGKFGPSAELDYEVELGAFLGPGSQMGQPVPITETEQHIAGVCLLNDWSARDIQRWEYQPLGPFLGKNFATSISPWIVTLDALEPFRVASQEHELPVLPYLRATSAAAFDITLEAWLKPHNTSAPVRLSAANFKGIYWTLAQMVAHHTSNGCPIRPADLIASGTVSGPSRENRGCLLELTWKGGEPLLLPDGQQRTFLQDGDEVILKGYCAGDGFATIGLGSCCGVIMPAGCAVAP